MFFTQPLTVVKIDEMISLEILHDHHAEPLLDLLNKNRPFLRQWLPWVDNMQTVENFRNYINRCKRQLEAATDLSYVIFTNNAIAGRIGLHYIDLQNKTGSIGYWIGEEFTGTGIVTKSCKAIILFGFHELMLNRIEIKCATGNIRSAAVAERLNFTKEGILREAELVNDQFIDLSLYSLLRKDWKD